MTGRTWSGMMSSIDTAWDAYERGQLGDWSDVTHRQSFDVGVAAYKAEVMQILDEVEAEMLAKQCDPHNAFGMGFSYGNAIAAIRERLGGKK